MIRKLYSTVALMACLFVAAQVARADTYSFSSNNFGQVGSLGIITTTLVGGTIQVSVQINPNYVIHNAGIGLNVNPAYAGITLTNIVNSAIFSQDLNSHQFDGYGSFVPSAVSNQSTAQARLTATNTVSFTVNTTTVGGFQTAHDIFSFAAQLAPLVDNGATGFATTTILPGPSPVPTQFGTVPEPSSMFLLGSGLLGAAGYLRRRYGKRLSE
jgi:PEP-CTERM motif